MKSSLSAFREELEKISSVHVSKHYGKDRTGKPSKHQLPLLRGDLAEYRAREAEAGGGKGDCSSLGRDAKGYYAYTHRARSKSYPRPSEIPLSVIKFIGSTA